MILTAYFDTARKMYLTAWNGRSRLSIDRIGRGSVVAETACLSILGGIQPGLLIEYIDEALLGASGNDGLIPRFQLAVWPDQSKEWKHVDRYPDSEVKNNLFKLIKDVVDVEWDRIGSFDQFDKDKIPYVNFTAEAQLKFNSWWAELEAEVRKDNIPPYLEEHYTKYKSLIPSLALIFELIDNIDGFQQRPFIGITALNKAIEFSRYLKSHALRIYSVGENINSRAAQRLLEKIQSDEIGPVFTLRELYRKGWKLLNNAEKAEEACEILVKHFYLKKECIEDAQRTIYTVNPLTFQ